MKCDVEQNEKRLDCNAKLSDDGRKLVMQIVNPTANAIESRIQIDGFVPQQSVAHVIELAGPLDAANTASNPDSIIPRLREWIHSLKDGNAKASFPPYSVTVIRWE